MGYFKLKHSWYESILSKSAIRKIGVICLLACLCQFVSPVSAEEKEYARMPWHLADLWWDIGEDTLFESYSIDVTISNDIPSSKNLYIAPIGLGHLSKIPFYGGIQTQADGYTKINQQLRKIGPGFLMSMWRERSLDAIRPSMGGYLQSSGHEGDFVSIRRPYNWSKGTYTYKIVRMDKEFINGKPYTWVGAFVFSHAKGENIFIGALRFQGDRLVLSSKIASFIEVYGKQIPVREIPKVTVKFGNLRVNGKVAKIKSVEAIYPKGVPDYAEAQPSAGSVEIKVGLPVSDRTTRQTKITLK